MAELAHLTISGPPLMRGQQYGEGLRGLIQDRDRKWKDVIGRTTGRPAARFIEEFLQATQFVPAIEAATPDLLSETKGMAEGAGLAYGDILAAQLMDEEWWFSEKYRAGQHHCSSLGSLDAGKERAILGQTMDLPSWMDGFQTLLTVQSAETGLTAHVLTVAGMIGLCGVNSAGLGLCVNTLSDLSSRLDGLPVAFVSRGVLARANHDDALAFLSGVSHASGQNYIVADRRHLSDVECSANNCVTYKSSNQGAKLVWHANHALGSTDRRPTGSQEAGRENSVARTAVLDRRLNGRDAIDLQQLKDVLSDRSDAKNPICRRIDHDHMKPGRYFSFATVVWEIDIEIVAHVAPGPLDTVSMRAFPLEPGAYRTAAD